MEKKKLTKEQKITAVKDAIDWLSDGAHDAEEEELKELLVTLKQLAKEMK